MIKSTTLKGVIMFIEKILKIIGKLILSGVLIGISVVIELFVLGPIIGITNTIILLAVLLLGSFVGGLIYVIKRL